MAATLLAIQSAALPGDAITFSEMDDGNGNYINLNNAGNVHLLMKNGLSGGAAVKAHGTITSSLSQVTDGKIITIDAKVYTFKTTLTPTEGQVLIGTDYSDTLVHLKAAINHTGTPDTEYKCAIAHPTVEATTLTSSSLIVEARTAGIAGNDLVLTSDETTYTLDPADGSLHAGAAATTNIIVTIVAPGLCSYGDAHDIVITMPEGTTWDSGYIIPPRRFQDSNKFVQITYSGAATDANCLIAAIAQA
jgi:hypothetical protein